MLYEYVEQSTGVTFNAKLHKNAETTRESRLVLDSLVDSWEQRKLGDIADFSKGSGYSKADIQETGTPIILYGRLYTKYELVISDVDTFADVRPSSVFSKGGEVIVPASGETAEDISIAAVVEKPGVLLGGDLNIVSPSSNLIAPFLALTISHGRAHDALSKRAQGKSVVHLHNDDLQMIDVFLPSEDEQEAIGSFFRNIDHLITLHQRKPFFNEMEVILCLQKLSGQTCSVNIMQNGLRCINRGR